MRAALPHQGTRHPSKRRQCTSMHQPVHVCLRTPQIRAHTRLPRVWATKTRRCGHLARASSCEVARCTRRVQLPGPRRPYAGLQTVRAWHMLTYVSTGFGNGCSHGVHSVSSSKLHASKQHGLFHNRRTQVARVVPQQTHAPGIRGMKCLHSCCTSHTRKIHQILQVHVHSIGDMYFSVQE